MGTSHGEKRVGGDGKGTGLVSNRPALNHFLFFFSTNGYLESYAHFGAFLWPVFAGLVFLLYHSCSAVVFSGSVECLQFITIIGFV